MSVNLSIKIGKLKLKNPIMVASGTFGYGGEFKDFIDLRQLGAIVTKTITLNPRKGNPPPRTCETPAGMLNSIGLDNPGLAGFIKDKLPFLKRADVPIIVSIASEGDPREFVTLSQRLERIKSVAAIELNISCPNIRPQAAGRKPQATGRRLLPKSASLLISQSSEDTYRVVRAVRKATTKTLITKLSPNVTDITEIALAAERAGSDAISLINTILGMSVNIKTRRPALAAITGGLSGPAIRPVAVRMVWEVYRKIQLPIIGMGGIIDTQSALEFFLVGASAISVGTGNFVNPRVSIEIIKGIRKYLMAYNINDIKKIIGSVKI